MLTKNQIITKQLPLSNQTPLTKLLVTEKMFCGISRVNQEAPKQADYHTIKIP